MVLENWGILQGYNTYFSTNILQIAGMIKPRREKVDARNTLNV
jgi:hypothetical protein